MGEFGWAYVKGALTASGPTGSIQFKDDQAEDGTTGLTGSAALLFVTGNTLDDLDGPYELRLTGTFTVLGDSFLSGNLTVLGDTTTISASNLIIADPVIGLGFGTGSAHTGAVGDRGFIFGLEGDLNQAMIWDQSSASFVIGKVGEQAPSKDPGQGAGADYDIRGDELGVLKVGGLIGSGTTDGGLRNSGFIHGCGVTSSGEILASGNIRSTFGGFLSGGLGYFNKQVNMADNLRVSGTVFLGHGQGEAAMAPAVLLHHNVTGALWVTSSHCSKFSGSLSSSIELFGWQIRTSGDLIASGAVSGGIGYFNKQVNMADNLRLSGTAFLGHGQGTTGMAPAVLLHHNVTGALWVTSSHATRLSGAVAITHMHPGTNTLDIAGGNTTTNVVNIAADDCLTTGKALFIDHNHGAAASATPAGISYDFDKDAVAGDGAVQVFTAIDVDMNDGVINHANAEVTMKGIDIAIESTNVQGTITNIGIDISGSKADSNIGIRTTMDDAAGSPDIVMSSSLNNNDYGVIYVGANGVMTLATVDQDAANANIVLAPDGKVSVSSNFEVLGTTTLGDASGDSVTIYGTTVNIPNVAAGTDNTVVIYNGSTLLTDEIDSRVWGSSLLDGAGASNEVAHWTDSNTLEGDPSLTLVNVSADENYLRVVGEFSASTIRAEKDIMVTGSISGGVGYFNEQVNMADNLRVSGTAFIGHGQGGAAMAPVVKLHHNVTGALWVTSSHCSKFSGSLSSSGEIFAYELVSSGDLNVSGAASIKGNTTLGDASGDTATINAATIVLANVAAGTDNTVLVYNGSTIVTDEIDSRVWGSTLIDASGTPSNNQIAVWTDANTVEGEGSLTYDSDTSVMTLTDSHLRLDNTGAPASEHALFIDSVNTTVQVAQIKALNTTSNVMEITGSALTTGGLLHLQSNSSDMGNRTLFTVHNDHASAAGVQMVHFKNDAVGGDGDPILLVESTAAETEAIVEIRNSNTATDKPPILKLHRGSWADADDMGIGTIIFQGVNDPGSPSKIAYASIVGSATDTTQNDEAGRIVFNVFAGGTAGTAASTNLFSIGGEDVANATQCEVVVNDAGIDCDFRIEGDNDTHLLFVDATHDAIGIGANVYGASHVTGAVLNIIGDNSQAKPTLSITHAEDTNNAVNIIANSVTTAVVMDVAGTGVTQGALMALSASALTTGKVIEIDLNSAGTTGVSPAGIKIDFDRSGDMGSGQTANYVAHKVEMTDASDDHNNAAVVYMIGMDVDIDSAEAIAGGAGTNINIGVDVKCTDAAKNYGIRTITDDDIASADLLMVSDGDNLDYAALACGANGALNVVTSGSNTDRTANMAFIADGVISSSAANGTKGFYVQSTGSHFEGGGIGVHVVGNKIATGSLGVNAHYDPTSLKVSTGGGDVVLFGADTANTMAANRLVYLNTSGEWIGADADAVGSSGGVLLGICLGADPSDGVLLRGFHHLSSVQGSFAKGAACYVSEAIGEIDFTAPAAAGDVVRVVGFGTSVTNVIYFNPDNTWIEL